jgi:hypothetical protein
MAEDSRWEDVLSRLRDLAQKQAELSGIQVNPSVLLPGEDPQSPHADDATHWASVYRELINSKEAIVRKIREEKAGLPAEAEPELDRDVQISELELERLRLHLGYWEDQTTITPT